MIAALLILAGIVVLIVVCCCKVSGQCSRQIEKKDPCDSCVRWDECNGVDESCPCREGG